MSRAAMESTGVYWRPVYAMLEPRFELMLVNARHVKQVPGRKTDAGDCEWLARLLDLAPTPTLAPELEVKSHPAM